MSYVKKHFDSWVINSSTSDWAIGGNAACTTECDLRLQYATCVATVSENKAYKDFSSGYTDVPQNISLDYYTPTCGERHQGCKPWNENGNSLMIEGKLEQKGLDLSMLGASRQVYEEASLLLWSTNTFSFEDPESFDKVLSKLTSLQKKRVTKMHISMPWLSYQYEQWERALNIRLLQKLKGLKTVHLCFDQDLALLASCLYKTMLQKEETSSDRSLALQQGFLFLDYPQLEPFGLLQMLHLQHVTVVIADKVGNAVHLANRWSIQQKREVAEKVRHKLLDPDGGRVLVAECTVKQEVRAKEREAIKAEEAGRRTERAERKALKEARKAA